MWRKQYDGEPKTEKLAPGVCLTIPHGTAFQFRADETGDALEVVAVTMPPWPQNDEVEAQPQQGVWAPSF